MDRGLLAPITPPPGIAITIPPPPAPSLSLQLHQLRDDDYEEQPERMTSHLPPPPEIEDVEIETEVMPSEPKSKRGQSDNNGSGILQEYAGDHIEPASEIVTSVEVAEEVIPSEPEPSAVEAPALPAGAPSGNSELLPIPENVSPELVGTPQTDAEREELAKAKEEAWPTTRGDD
jgi:hypothetical protein